MSNPNGALKAAVIGAGIGQVHIEGYQKTGHADVAVLCDVNEERAREVAEQFGIPKVVTSVEDVWAEAPDAVSVCVPNAFHADIAEEALRRNIAVLCEKPMADTLENARRMRDAARRSSAVFMMGYNNRFRSESAAIRAAVEDGTLGSVYYAKCGWVRRHGIPGMGGWFTTKALSGGGPMMDIGVHALDLTLYLMGFPKVVSVTGTTYAEFGPRGRGMGTWSKPEDAGTFDVEDLAAGFIRFENGASLAIEASWAQFVPQDNLYSVVYGTEGGASVSPFAFYKDGPDGKPADETPVLEPTHGHHAEVAHFVDCIRTGRTPISTVDQGYAVMEILDALYRSAASGHEETL